MTSPVYGMTELANSQVNQYAQANENMRTLELADTKIRINAQTGTSYTFVLEDRGKLVSMSNGSANIATVPPNSSVAFDVGTMIYILQGGAGLTSIAAGAGVTIQTSQTLISFGQYAMLALIKIATDTWVLTGERELA